MQNDPRFDPLTVDLGALLRVLTGPRGVIIADRYHNLRRYPACFVGSDLVDLLVERFSISRNQAVRLGQRLLAHEHIQHVLGEHDFKDEPLYYRFGPCGDAPTEPAADISRPALVELARGMRARGGVPVRTHRRWLIDYPQTFVGSRAVDWIVARTGLARDEAESVGRALLAANLIRHVLDEHDFADGGRLFRFV